LAAAPQPSTLTVPSDLAYLAVARNFVEEFCRDQNLEPALVHNIVLAVNEAISNIMRHAHRGRPSAAVQVQCWLRDDRIEIHLLDEGPPFNFDALPALDPAEVRIGGRGVFLMRSLMDEITCAPRPEGGNRLRMVKRIQPSA
jgi:anti-sigma regulatory factor (Ser/Thr protein kinase)